jgi:hypothetical protein
MLNRGVVIVRPKQPYLDWASAKADRCAVTTCCAAVRS